MFSLLPWRLVVPENIPPFNALLPIGAFLPLQVDSLSTVRVHLQKDLRSQDARQEVMKRVGEVVSRLVDKSGRVPTLDPREDMQVRVVLIRVKWHKEVSIRSRGITHTTAYLSLSRYASVRGCKTCWAKTSLTSWTAPLLP